MPLPRPGRHVLPGFSRGVASRSRDVPAGGASRGARCLLGTWYVSEIKRRSSHRDGGRWGHLVSSQPSGGAAVHMPCGRPPLAHHRAVDSATARVVRRAVTPRLPGVVLRLSQARPQVCPQPVRTDCRARHCYVTVHPDRACCLMRLVSSVTWLYIDRRSAIRERIFRSACITVVWSRPPNCCPIFGSDRSVSSRHRYMAICRAVTRTRDRDVPQRSSIDSPK